ncbi:MAG: hypothetical protein Q8K87_03030, partial [Hydrogenophaga sp.]|nr:hypothetical protein [Hydrogenophaga sp.]
PLVQEYPRLVTTGHCSPQPRQVQRGGCAQKDALSLCFLTTNSLTTTEDDLASFYAVSESATHKLNAQWMKAILAALPDKFWSMSQEGIPQLDQTGSAASLRLLSTAWDGKEEQESVLHQAARKEVMQALLDHIPEADRGAYRDMLSWVDATGREESEVPGDTRFGLALLELERMMDAMVAEQELLWRRQSTLDDSQTTPVEVREKFSAIALRQTFYFMARCWEYGKNTREMPDSLLALLSANMSCNKAVLEYAAMNYRGREALEMTVSFLRELNAQGVQEVPLAFDDLNPAECDEAIFTTFQKWFGHKGVFVGQGTSFAKHMTNSDIQVLVDLSCQLQAVYIATRGSSPVSPAGQAQKIHGGSSNRFIFALVLASAFYSKARTSQEFVVGKNSLYAIFPDRQSIKRGDLLTIHAIDALLKAYGLVFFGNRGWNLAPDDIEHYAQGTEIRRLHNQVAILCAVKGRSSEELMGLYENLKQLPVNPDLVFERLGMGAVA